MSFYIDEINKEYQYVIKNYFDVVNNKMSDVTLYSKTTQLYLHSTNGDINEFIKLCEYKYQSLLFILHVQYNKHVCKHKLTFLDILIYNSTQYSNENKTTIVMYVLKKIEYMKLHNDVSLKFWYKNPQLSDRLQPTITDVLLFDNPVYVKYLMSLYNNTTKLYIIILYIFCDFIYYRQERDKFSKKRLMNITQKFNKYREIDGVWSRCLTMLNMTDDEFMNAIVDIAHHNYDIRHYVVEHVTIKIYLMFVFTEYICHYITQKKIYDDLYSDKVFSELLIRYTLDAM